MKISNSTRTSIFTVLLVTVVTLGIGSYSAFHTRSAELSEVNASLDFVAQEAIDNPEQSIGAALFAIEQLTLNATLTLLTEEGQETVVRESSLSYLGAPAKDLIEKATAGPVSIKSGDPYQLRAVRLDDEDFLLIARSTNAIDEHFEVNLRALGVVTFFVDLIAGVLLFFFFRRANRRDEYASLARMQEFLGDASHELRTPLTVVKGYVEMLSKKQLVTAEDQDRAFTRVGTEINRMENLIQDLLLLAELGESGSRDIEKMDVSELLSAHGTDFTTLNPGRKVALKIENDLAVVASRDYLSRFIQNAFTNIMRHTSADAAVTITCSKSGKNVLIMIEDAGQGLPEGAYAENIRSLNRFDKSRSRENGGSGLGMSIMSAVIEKLNGTFSLRKSALGGLAVVVSLPLAKD
ncbi:sensor histidine kinase [Candidatus Planktophila versatilis]|uniref:sensor histidine kinase n=1 Tax=Candidatus Planktophila versatilis TaxID=1884905 RepID=UPI003CF5F17C